MKNLFLFSMLLWSNMLLAQQWEIFNSDEYLNDFCFVDNQIWIASSGGVLVYDISGKELQRYNLLNQVGSVASEFDAIGADKNKTLWAVQDNKKGIDWWTIDQKSNKWKFAFQQKNGTYLKEKNGIIYRTTGYLLEKYIDQKWQATALPITPKYTDWIISEEQVVWLYQDATVVRVEGEDIQAYTLPNPEAFIYSIFLDKQDRLWVVADEEEEDALFYLENGTWIEQDPSKYLFHNSYADNLLQDKGTILFESEHKLYLFDGEKTTFHSTFPISKSGKYGTINRVKKAPNGTLWASFFVATKEELFQYVDGQWQKVNLQPSNTQLMVSEIELPQITLDHNGTLWCNAYTKILRYQEDHWDSIPSSYVDVLQFNPVDNSLWIANTSGVSRYADGKEQLISSASTYYIYHQKEATYSVIEDDDEIYRMLRWKNNQLDTLEYQFHPELYILSHDQVLYQDITGMWFGTKGDSYLHYFDGKKLELYDFFEDPLFAKCPIDEITHVYKTKNYTAVYATSTRSNESYIFKLDAANKWTIETLRNKNYALFKDKALDKENNTWLVSNRGIEKIDYQSGERTLFRKCEGLQHITISPDQTIWVTGENAIWSYQNKKWKKHPQPYGLEIQKIIADTYNNVWLFGGNDLLRYQP